MTPTSPAAVDGSMVPMTDAQRSELDKHKQYLSRNKQGKESRSWEDARNSPIIAGEILRLHQQHFPQYGLLAENLDKKNLNIDKQSRSVPAEEDNRLLLNVTPPWSMFLCGSQGSGKSHTLSCILENCLLGSDVASLHNPLTGIVFHWDRYSSYGTHQLCEAAYLVSRGIPVKVLVSRSNEHNMRKIYENLPGLENCNNKPVVVPMMLNEEKLDVTRMLTMMGIKGEEKDLPLYMEVRICF